MYLFFIGNPTAGAGRAKKSWKELEIKLIELGWHFDIRWSDSPAQIRDLVLEGILRHPDLIVSLGGDGTAHEVIKSMYEAQSKATVPLFTVFPKGTGNDWARYWRIPHTIPEWLEMVKMQKTYIQDLGQVEYMDETGAKKSEVFNNVAGMAYDAYVADYIESQKKKMGVGRLQYLWYIFRCLFGYKLQRSKLTWPGGTAQDFFYTINVGICPYSGGGLSLVPHAVHDDGLLAVTAVRPLTKWQVFLFSRHFYSGRIHQHRKVLAFKAEELSLEPWDRDEIIKLETEGEYLGHLPARFTILKNALKLCAP